MAANSLGQGLHQCTDCEGAGACSSRGGIPRGGGMGVREDSGEAIPLGNTTPPAAR